MLRKTFLVATAVILTAVCCPPRPRRGVPITWATRTTVLILACSITVTRGLTVAATAATTRTVTAGPIATVGTAPTVDTITVLIPTDTVMAELPMAGLATATTVPGSSLLDVDGCGG